MDFVNEWAELLRTEETPAEKLAGVNRFDIFGDYLYIDRLATLWHMDTDAVLKKSAAECLTKLHLEKLRYEYRIDLNKIQNQLQ